MFDRHVLLDERLVYVRVLNVILCKLNSTAIKSNVNDLERVATHYQTLHAKLNVLVILHSHLLPI